MCPFACERFEKYVFLEHAGTGDGKSPAAPAPIANQDLMTIEAGMVIESSVTMMMTTGSSPMVT